MWIQFVPPDGPLVFREDYPILSGEQQGAKHTSVCKRSKGPSDTFHLRFLVASPIACGGDKIANARVGRLLLQHQPLAPLANVIHTTAR